MPLAVVLHGVSPTHHLTREFRVPLYALADTEEGRPGAALVEEVEHSGVIRGSGPSSILMAISPGGGRSGQSGPVRPEQRTARCSVPGR